jgi:4,5-dihydroxyphthalate decarboxylase
MTRLRLSAALSRNAFTAPILDGTVEVEGVEIVGSVVHPSELFWRQLRFGDFDISEFSLSSLVIAIERGLQDWTALPIFTTRRFFHTGISVRRDAGIDHPADLAGRRVGVPEYQQTAAVWSRAALAHEFNVWPQDMDWVMERSPERSHGGVTGFSPPGNIKLTYADASISLSQMLAIGDLDAVIVNIHARNLVDPGSHVDTSNVRPLFGDPVAEGLRYYAATGLLPVNHTIVIRSRLLAEHPWLALNLYGAFVRAKEHAYAALREGLAPFVQTGLVNPDPVPPNGPDPLPYGIRSQRNVLDALSEYSHEQGLTARRVGLEELFAVRTLDL